MSFADKFIVNSFVDTKGKKIEALGERWALVPTAVITALHRKVPEHALFSAGEHTMEGTANNIKKRLGINNNYAFVKIAERAISASGWGQFKVEDFDQEKSRGIVFCEDPPETSAGRSHLLRGMIAGFCKAMTGKEMAVREADCTEKKTRSMRFYVTLKDPASPARN